MLVPVIAPAATGASVTVTPKLLAVPLKQPFVGVTVTLPDAAVPQFTVIDVVFWPLATDAPAGTTQL